MVTNRVQYRSSSSFLLAVIVGLTVLGAVLFGYSAVNASQETTIELVPPSNATAGDLITVRVVARNVRDLGGFQSTVRFDPAQLRLTGATLADDLTHSGRDLMQLGPVLRDDAAVLGAVTCPVGNCADAQPQRSFLRMLAGVGGDVDLGDVSFVAATPGSYNLVLDNAQLVDPQGNRLTVRAVGATLTVSN
jgi:hypothetical protein